MKTGRTGRLYAVVVPSNVVQSGRMLIANVRRRIVPSLILSVIVFAGLIAYGDVTQIAAALMDFPWRLLPGILGLTLLNYALRFLKWQFYLGQIGVQGLSRYESLLIFGSGMGMTITPGKMGEWLKSYLLRERAGTPLTLSAPIIVAERLTDGLALAFLASGGLLLFPVAWQAVAVAVGAAAMVLLVVWVRPLAGVIFAAAEGIGPLRSRVHHLHALYESTRTVLGPRNLVVGLGLGIISWGSECLAFWLVLQGLGLEGTLLLTAQAAFILATSTLGGAMFVTPGGLGVAEGSIIGLSQVLLGLSRNLAATAALLIRLSTFWFGISIGLVALVLISRRMAHPQAATGDAADARPAGQPLSAGNEVDG